MTSEVRRKTNASGGREIFSGKIREKNNLNQEKEKRRICYGLEIMIELSKGKRPESKKLGQGKKKQIQQETNMVVMQGWLGKEIAGENGD